MDVYFPQTFESNQHGEQIKIKVWSNDAGQPGELIFSKFFTLPKTDSINQFYRIALNSPFQVKDTFYIGWEQLSSTKLFVGLDKNTNSQDKIWINTTGEWEPNNNQIEGSLMIRPFFITPETYPLATIQETDIKKITVYPNPSSRYFKFISPENTNWSVLTASGKQAQPLVNRDNEITILDFENLPKGLYILKFIYKDSIQTERILLID